MITYGAGMSGFDILFIGSVTFSILMLGLTGMQVPDCNRR